MGKLYNLFKEIEFSKIKDFIKIIWFISFLKK